MLNSEAPNLYFYLPYEVSKICFYVCFEMQVVKEGTGLSSGGREKRGSFV